MSDQKYILAGHEIVPVDLMEWASWFETADRHVAKTEVINPSGETCEISTVFLGLDHRFGQPGDPLLFETLIFGGKHADEMDRYSTWDKAEAGHKRFVEMVRDE